MMLMPTGVPTYNFCKCSTQIFHTFFKTLVGKTVVVELKNDLQIEGTLDSVDQYLNFKLSNIKVVESDKYPQLQAVRNLFIRGSVVRYVQVPKDEVDTEALQDATRKETMEQKGQTV